MEDEPLRVAVFFTGPVERRRALGALRQVARDDVGLFSGVAEGWLTPSLVSELVGEGFAVDLLDSRLPQPASPRALAIGLELTDEIKQEASRAAIDPRSGTLVVSDQEADALDPRIHQHAGYDATPDPGDVLAPEVYFIHLSAPITRAQRLEFDALGVDIGEFLPPNRYRTFLSQEQYAAVRELPYVEQVTRYRLEDTVTPELADLIRRARRGDPDVGEAEAHRREFECVLHRERDLPKVLDLLEATEDTVPHETSNLRVRFEAPVSVPLLAALAAMPEVRKLTPYEAPRFESSAP
jgi:hypothetical protein